MMYKLTKDENGGEFLAILEGPIIADDMFSENGRYYPNGIIATVLNEKTFMNKVANRTAYGTIGHDTPYTDAMFGEGKFSHVILSINEDGTGKIGILDSPTGRILYGVIRAKSQIYTSMRALGSFEEGLYEGMPIVDAKTFQLEGIDIVLEPGIEKAQLQLIAIAESNEFKKMCLECINLADQILKGK